MPFSVEEAAQHGQPAAIDYEREGYDGPAPGNVATFPRPPLFSAPIAEEAPRASAPRITKEYTGVIKAWIDILSARLICLISVLGAVGMFAYATYDPIPWRTYTVAAYAVVVLFPTIYLAIRKG